VQDLETMYVGMRHVYAGVGLFEIFCATIHVTCLILTPFNVVIED